MPGVDFTHILKCKICHKCWKIKDQMHGDVSTYESLLHLQLSVKNTTASLGKLKPVLIG